MFLDEWFHLFYHSDNMNKTLLLRLGILFLVSSCGGTSSSTSLSLTMDDTWKALFPGDDFFRFNASALSPSEQEADVGINNIYALNENNQVLGYAFQATVDGNGGRKSLTFRLTIYDNIYQGFIVTSHREHATFGLLQINALSSNLAGKIADFSQVQTLLIQANAGRAGISETYDGLMPAIEAMTLKYQ